MTFSGLSFGVIGLVSFGLACASAQDMDCKKTPCASGKCTQQCFAGNCSSYCAFKQIGAEISSPSSLDIHIDNVSPEISTKIRSLLENAQ